MKTIKVPTIAFCGLCGVAASSIHGLIRMKKEKEELEETLDYQTRKADMLSDNLSATSKAYWKLVNTLDQRKEQG